MALLAFVDQMSDYGPRPKMRSVWKTHAAEASALALGAGMVLIAALLTVLACARAGASESADLKARSLFKTGTDLSEKTDYLEALEMFEEARHLLDRAGQNETLLYADVLFALAQTKIKGRLHQNFPASYVKAALEDVQAANKLREKLPRVAAQSLAEGYFLEGYIHKKFFMRTKQAESCFVKCVKVDPGNAAAKRELSDVKTTTENR